MQELINEVKILLQNQFQRDLFDASIENLNASENKLCYNNFAYSIRELSRHILKELSPDAKVLNSPWYRNEIPERDNGITRAQRIKFAIQGGLSNDYVRDILQLEEQISEKKKNLVKQIGKLSKYTHINEDTFGINEESVKEKSIETLLAFKEFAIMIEETKSQLMIKLEDITNNELVSEAISNVYSEIDILAPRHHIQNVLATRSTVTGISDKYVKVNSQGTVFVVLEYGNREERANSDGLDLPLEFPFDSNLDFEIKETFPDDSNEVKSFEVDTSSWYE